MKKWLAKIDGFTDQQPGISHQKSDQFTTEHGSEEQRFNFTEVCLVGERPVEGRPVAEVVLPNGVILRLYRQIDIKLLPALIREVTGS